MSHNVYSRRQALWNNASVPNARDLALWDSNQFKGLDGDNGGTWYPKTPIGIGGAGVQLSDGSQFNQGGIQTELGGRFVLGANDFPTFGTDRIRTVRFPLRGLSGGTGVVYKQNLSVGGRPIHRSGWFDPSAAKLWFPIDPRYIHNGAAIAQIRLYAFQTQFVPALSSPSFIQQADLWTLNTGFDYAVTTQWVPTPHNYLFGDITIPSGAQAQTGLYYQCTFGGTSGASQPAPWPASIGGTVTNGGATWQAVGYAGTAAQTYPYSASAYYNAGQSRTFILTPYLLAPPLLANAADVWAISVVQDGGSWCYSSAEIDYTTIPDMSFA